MISSKTGKQLKAGPFISIYLSFFLLLAPIVLVCCTPTELKQQEDLPFQRLWISKHLIPYRIDDGKTMYGSGYLLRLEPDSSAALLGADFYWKNDSLYQGGEPGRMVKTGTWNRRNQTLLLNLKLLEAGMKLPGIEIGQLQLDTLRMLNKNLFLYKEDTLIPVTKLSRRLEEMLNTNILLTPNN